MYYAINLKALPEDLVKEARRHIIYGNPTRGIYLHIEKETYEFYGAYEELSKNHEPIDEQKLKEILLLKHLED